MATDTVQRIQAFSNTDREKTFTAFKYQLMAENPFRFFRATDQLFFEDLQAAQAAKDAPVCWICGDLQLENYRTYKGQDGILHFGIGDFTNAALAPVSWDICRMVCSIMIAMKALDMKSDFTGELAACFVDTYADALASDLTVDVNLLTAKGIVLTFMRRVSQRRRKQQIRARTEIAKEKIKLRVDGVRFFPIEMGLKKSLRSHMDQWIQQSERIRPHYKVVDACFRVAGTGSIGLNRYCLLLQHTKHEEKCLFMDMLVAKESTVAANSPVKQPAWSAEVERIIEVRHMLQAFPPEVVSSTRFKEDDYVVSELQPALDSIDFLMLRDQVDNIKKVIRTMARIAASAHLRGAGRRGAQSADALIAYGKQAAWKKEVLAYCQQYATVVEEGYIEFVTAYKRKAFGH